MKCWQKVSLKNFLTSFNKRHILGRKKYRTVVSGIGTGVAVAVDFPVFDARHCGLWD